MPIDGQGIVAKADGGFSLEPLEFEAPSGREVLVQIKAAGVCHTDFDVMRNARQPWIMGHEGSGIVQAVGPNCSEFKAGDHVVLNWALPCGKCFQCEKGNDTLCEDKQRTPPERNRWRGKPIGRAFGIGTMATHTLVMPEALTRMNESIPFASASILSCGVMTGVGSVLNASPVGPGDTVVVLGCGGVGLNIVQGARIAGAVRIIAIDLSENRLEMARSFGATDVLRADPSDTGLRNAADIVHSLTHGRGADACFESTAVPTLGEAPLRMIRNGGIAVQASGIEEKIPFDMELFEWNKTYINPLYGMCRPSVDFPRLLSMYQSGDLLLDEQVTRTYSLGELAAAFDDMHAGRNAKGVLIVGEDHE
jgi:S-(hydroxymethyl)glutathione dehydrogenase/alcohol dehydrogenase